MQASMPLYLHARCGPQSLAHCVAQVYYYLVFRGTPVRVTALCSVLENDNRITFLVVASLIYGTIIYESEFISVLGINSLI